MSRPEAASEPSMDDILASIRKIIAEEPAAVRAPPEPRSSVRPVAPAAQAAAQPAPVQPIPSLASPAMEPATATLSRALSGLSTSAAAAPVSATPQLSATLQPVTSPTGQQPAMPQAGAAAFDDLDDLLEEAPASPLRPSSTSGSAAGSPGMSTLKISPTTPAATPQAPSATSMSAPFGAARSLDAPRSSFEDVLRGRAPPPSSAAPAAPGAFGDLGSVVPARAGFDAPPAATAAQPGPESFQWSGPKFAPKGAPTGESPPFGASVLKAPQAQGAPARPAVVATPGDLPEPIELARYEVIAAMPAPAAKSGDKPADVSGDVPGVHAETAPALAPIARRDDAAPTPHQANVEQPAVTPEARANFAAAAPSPVMPVAVTPLPAADEPPLEPEVFVPLGSAEESESAEAGFEAAAIESTAAAASALGALAAGLAASSKSMLPPFAAAPVEAPAAEAAPDMTPAEDVPSAAMPPLVASVAMPEVPAAAPQTGPDRLPSTAAAPLTIPAPAAPSVTLVAAPQPAAASVDMPAATPALASGAVSAAPPQPAAPVRSLDDTVADLLRPMLRQWLSENMPRIVEKALRIEVAESVRTAVPPPKPD